MQSKNMTGIREERTATSVTSRNQMNYQLLEQKPHSGTEMLIFKQNMMLKEMSLSIKFS
jgi:hypothetical protein